VSTHARLGSRIGHAMKNGMYLVTAKGFDGVDWPPGGASFFFRMGCCWEAARSCTSSGPTL